MSRDCVSSAELGNVRKARPLTKSLEVQPHFCPRHTEIWIWEWGKMGKKVYEKKGKQSFNFENRKNSHFFSWFAKIWIWGWEKVGKKYMEREGKRICFNTLLVYCYHYFLYIKQDLSCSILYDLTMTLSSHFFTRNLNVYTAHKND